MIRRTEARSASSPWWLALLPMTFALIVAPIASTTAFAQDEEKPAEEAKPQEEADPNDPEVLKARIAELEKKVAELELTLAIKDLEALGAGVAVEGPDDGPKTTRVTLPKLWRGDAAALDALKGLPSVTVVYVDNPEFNDEAAAKLKEIKGITALTIMSPALTGAALEHLKELPSLGMLFLTGTEVGDEGLTHLKELPELKELSLSKTKVTDAGLATLAELPQLRTLYLIGTEVSDEAVAKLQEAKPDARIVR
ncbi:leucine-rich repeat domain-containing protein [Tautonia rosea]|uniref:hypothetical protein n=1 Tax=Tautonia rosea TaxID=2728037 RepID=UPI00147620BC|nr:hypothetical protein [Tautonia rosea]